MSRTISRVFVVVIVAVAFAVGTATSVSAEGSVAQYKRKPCKEKNYGQQSEDEEKTSGDCRGTVPTPEPVSIVLFTVGLAGVGFAARRRLRRSEQN